VFHTMTPGSFRWFVGSDGPEPTYRHYPVRLNLGEIMIMVTGTNEPSYLAHMG